MKHKQNNELALIFICVHRRSLASDSL